MNRLLSIATGAESASREQVVALQHYLDRAIGRPVAGGRVTPNVGIAKPKSLSDVADAFAELLDAQQGGALTDTEAAAIRSTLHGLLQAFATTAGQEATTELPYRIQLVPNIPAPPKESES